MKKTSEAQLKAVRECDRRNYFKKIVRFPKNLEEEIRKAAEDSNESLNEFIVKAVINKIGAE